MATQWVTTSHTVHWVLSPSKNTIHSTGTEEKLARMYEDELMRHCQEDVGSSKGVTWTEFKNYAFAKEAGMFSM